uniref:Late embryogenesis abundant protein LEA-2 subgroup domain-containing protein n=2 Tax=Oryza brachyantha TaxID=4533 RepID=J3L3U4_ORYBR
MNRVTLEDLDTDFLGTAARHPLSVNATLNADISIKNPNVASFRFGRSETDFYYAGETVGVAYAPDGEVGADRTVRMNVTLDVLADRVSRNVNATDLILGQDYNLTSYTEISGRVDVLGIYKRDLDIKMNCSITLEVGAFSTAQSKSTDCVASVS